MFFKDKGTPGGQNNKPNMKGKSMATNDVDTVEFNFEIGKNFDRYFPKNNLKNLLEKLELFSSHRRKSSRKKYPKKESPKIRDSLCKTNQISIFKPHCETNNDPHF